MNRSGVVVLAAVFIGLFALLSGFVGGTIFGGKAVAKQQVLELERLHGVP